MRAGLFSNGIRFLPPIVITDEQLHEGLEVVEMQRSKREGFVYVYLLSSGGEMFLLFPNLLDKYNKIAAGAKKAGLQQILHNDGFENSRLEDGRLTYPVLMEQLDPDLVKMQFQMSSMRTVGMPCINGFHDLPASSDT